ncbi:hypothetical protein EDEG_02688 [Edhazardia aedis USNM 41457]|uniref:V-SNARE coiled-coil homology domain-containing protein n=1 Tax=Edhazardia aedis (strain USNM 41457) TaxID=1003232 RepID=J8ZTB4_EDHAE|nr:hypothetical protein EDEG_02688 [Edhazardia aedis USNM 41457]|eukprot:EJW02923.1 hypothetical protein EDEG_02688 [Edhazardia aedis USNM 41457]
MDDDLEKQINLELEALQSKMKETLKEEEERGACIDDLFKKTEKLDERAAVFEHRTRETEWKMKFKVYKWYVIGAVIVITLILIALR